MLIYREDRTKEQELECGPMPNLMAALPNIGGALCSTPQSSADTFTTRVPCSNAAKTRNPLKFAGCPKLANRSQPLGSQSSSYCENMWWRHCCLTSFSDCWYVPKLRRYSPTKLCDDAQEVNFWIFWGPAFSASRMQHISDLHSKFALGPHHVWKYGRHPICSHWD